MSAWLDDTWEAALAEEAARRGLVSARTPARLGEAVARVSAAYNAAQHLDGEADARDVLAARLGFFLPRDVGKGAEALRELVGSGWAVGRDTLRILDLGAGLGATSLGAITALRRAGVAGEIAVTLVDQDATGLAVARGLLSRVPGVHVHTRAGDAAQSPGERFDLILIAQTVCELDRAAGPADRVARHAAWLRRLVTQHLTESGAIVVVEPALSGPVRHLMAVRDALVDAGLRPLAPCTHALACPMRADPKGWCHERRDVDLPSWLVPVARAAGLRWEGLTFAVLAFRRDNHGGVDGWRVVSDALESKGRVDRWLCGVEAGAGVVRRVGRLNRHRSDANAAWDDAQRGDVLAPWDGAIGADTPLHVRR